MVNKIRACVFISGNGSNLKSIIKSSRDYNFPIKIELIITNNIKAKGLHFAKKYSNRFLVYSKFLILLFLQLLKIIFYIFLFNKKEIINKSMRFSGALNSLLGKRSWYRPKLEFD